MGVCTKERKGVAAEVLMATPCTNSLGGESMFTLMRETLVCMARHFVSRTQPHREPPTRSNWARGATKETPPPQHTRKGKERARRRARPPGGGRGPPRGSRRRQREDGRTENSESPERAKRRRPEKPQARDHRPRVSIKLEAR